MDDNASTSLKAGLPYLNNAWMILGTALVNALYFLLACGGRQPVYRDLLFAALICGAVTSFINVLVVDHFIRKARMAGQLPPCVPANRFVAMLPKNKWLLIALFAVVFGAAAVLLNMAAVWFFEISVFGLIQCAVWQGVYSCLLSAKIAQFAVLRFAQDDCALPNEPPQRGSAKVVNPMPRLSAFGAWFNTVTDDFGFNMITGLLLGGTLIVDHNVIVTATTFSGIVISALLLGLIVTLRMAYPVLKSIREARLSGGLPAADKASLWLTRLPDKPMRLTLLLTLPIMLMSLAVFWSVLAFFHFEVLNFFQFFVIRTAYVSVLSKVVVRFAIARYRQPDIPNIVERQGASAPLHP